MKFDASIYWIKHFWIECSVHTCYLSIDIYHWNTSLQLITMTSGRFHALCLRRTLNFSSIYKSLWFLPLQSKTKREGAQVNRNEFLNTVVHSYFRGGIFIFPWPISWYNVVSASVVLMCHGKNSGDPWKVQDEWWGIQYCEHWWIFWFWVCNYYIFCVVLENNER